MVTPAARREAVAHLAMRARRDQVGVKDRLDQVLQT